MCTALNLNKGLHLFGRTLDYEHSFGEKIISIPRGYAVDEVKYERSFIGVGKIVSGFPLLFDGMNELGLCGAGLNFPGYAVYHKSQKQAKMFFSYQLLPYMLGMCGSVAEVRLQLENAVIAEGDFSKNMPSTPLHWIFADHKECITVESVKEGLKIYENPIGALTNSPDFAYQLTRISDFLGLSASNLPSSSYNDGFVPYSRGMGAIGLPGDFSSTSRLARASFLLKNTIIRDGSRAAVEDFFHIADSVAIPLGAVRSETDKPVCTLYTCCACSELGAYFYTTYSDRSIRRVKFDSDLTEPFEMEMK